MIIRKKVESNKRSACAWNSSNIAGISFGVTDYGPCLGYIDSDENGKWLRFTDPELKKLRSKTFLGVAKAMADQWG